MPKPDSVTMSNAARRGKLMARDPQVIVNLAREHSTQAILMLESLMMGKSRQRASVVTKEGIVIEIDVAVPPAVQLRAAEILLERGYGKTPQAIMVKTDEPLATGVHQIPIMERIAQLRAAQELGVQTTDLEASQVDEADEAIEINALEAPRAKAEDMI